MAMPEIQTRYPARVHITTTAEMAAELEALSAAAGTSVSAIVRAAVQAGLPSVRRSLARAGMGPVVSPSGPAPTPASPAAGERVEGDTGVGRGAGGGVGDAGGSDAGEGPGPDADVGQPENTEFDRMLREFDPGVGAGPRAVAGDEPGGDPLADVWRHDRDEVDDDDDEAQNE